MWQVEYTQLAPFEAHTMSVARKTRIARSTSAESDPQVLGFSLDDDWQAVKRIRDGLSFSTLVRFQKFSQLPMESIAQVLRTPPRTLARRKVQGHLTESESERLIRLARIYELALALFDGDRSHAVRWLCSPIRGLGSKIPVRCIETEPGARQVENLIGRLEHGVFS
jgi:putative toxin-antitoxin system antitoxin component (TIGR02293 family)